MIITLDTLHFSVLYFIFYFLIQSQLEAMRLKHLSTPAHLQQREEVRSHPQARRVSSDEYRGKKAGEVEGRPGTIPELTESFKRMLRFRNHRVPALVRTSV